MKMSAPALPPSRNSQPKGQIMISVSQRQRRVASYIGSGAADPVGWTQVAPSGAAPNGQVYVTDGGTPLRYKIDASGAYITKAA
jgi:hypothetical protein